MSLSRIIESLLVEADGFAFRETVENLDDAVGAVLDHFADQLAGMLPNGFDPFISAFDADGNQIELDMALVDAAAIEIDAENAIKTLRRERNRLLAETDYLALVDSTLTDEMRAYRQALRDLPANTEDPANPVWPTKPE